MASLAKVVANAKPSASVAYAFEGENFSYSDLNETLRTEFMNLAGTYALYRENRNTVFAIMEEVFDDALPRRVMEQYSAFAEIKQYKQGDKPEFIQRVSAASKRRAKQFITKVGLAGVYEVFRLDGKSFEVPVTAYGGAGQIGFEEFLDGRVDFADIMEVILEGLDEVIYKEIEKALVASIETMPEANKTVQSSFVEAEMDKLLSIGDSYGQTVIYCTYEFATTMVPSTGWVSDEMRNEKWNNGYLANYKGHKVIVMNQSYEDETNAKKVIDPSYAWLIPTGANKPVKIAFEGQSAVREVENDDWSREIQTYKKLGVATMNTNTILSYQNTSLTK